MRKLFVAAFLTFALSDGAGANSKLTLTGADIVSACTRLDPDWINFCNGYVQAVIDGMYRPGDGLCIPSSTSRAKIVDVVTSRLTASSELKKLNGASAAYRILLEAYPCSQTR